MKSQREHQRRFLIALLAILALLATACGGGNDDDAGSDSAGDRSGQDEGTEEGSDAEDDFVDTDEPEDSDSEAPFAGTDEGSTVETDGDDMAEGDEEAALAESRAPDATDASGGLFDEEQGDDGRDIEEPAPPSQDNRFANYGIRDFVDTEDDPLSTFALDVDTGSYSIARQWLNENMLPPRDSVRVEEYVNAFDYDYDDPRDALGISIDGGPSPFDDDNVLVRVGVQSERIDDEDRPDASLTFVIDTSGSMDQGGRLELVKESLEELLDELGEDDEVAIVEFDDSPSVVLNPTDVDDVDDILDAIWGLRPGGSTNVEEGLRLGYDLADEMYDDDRVNRVILLSDGVANAGLTDPDSLSEMIRRDADRGVQLLTIGVGMGNFNDVLMEQLADQGDGLYAYVDTNDEAERLFEDNLTATLVTLAIDAKIQVEFDEDLVEAYRLIGFENRGVRDSDFRNNDVDAGEIGAGHAVTAIYELELRRGVEPGDRGELGEVSLRWEEPGSGDITEIREDIDLDTISERWSDTDDSFKLAVSVATFAEVLRESPFADDIDLRDLEEEVEDLADRLSDRDVDELEDLIEQARRLS